MIKVCLINVIKICGFLSSYSCLTKKNMTSLKSAFGDIKGDILKMQLYNTFFEENSINNQRIKVCLLKVTKRCGF